MAGARQSRAAVEAGRAAVASGRGGSSGYAAGHQPGIGLPGVAGLPAPPHIEAKFKARQPSLTSPCLGSSRFSSGCSHVRRSAPAIAAVAACGQVRWTAGVDSVSGGTTAATWRRPSVPLLVPDLRPAHPGAGRPPPCQPCPATPARAGPPASWAPRPPRCTPAGQQKQKEQRCWAAVQSDGRAWPLAGAARVGFLLGRARSPRLCPAGDTTDSGMPAAHLATTCAHPPAGQPTHQVSGPARGASVVAQQVVAAVHHGTVAELQAWAARGAGSGRAGGGGGRGRRAGRSVGGWEQEAKRGWGCHTSGRHPLPWHQHRSTTHHAPTHTTSTVPASQRGPGSVRAPAPGSAPRPKTRQWGPARQAGRPPPQEAPG